jgi:hypothetical protein
MASSTMCSPEFPPTKKIQGHSGSQNLTQLHIHKPQMQLSILIVYPAKKRTGQCDSALLSSHMSTSPTLQAPRLHRRSHSHRMDIGKCVPPLTAMTKEQDKLYSQMMGPRRNNAMFLDRIHLMIMNELIPLLEKCA